MAQVVQAVQDFGVKLGPLEKQEQQQLLLHLLLLLLNGDCCFYFVLVLHVAARSFQKKGGRQETVYTEAKLPRLEKALAIMSVRSHGV